MHQIFTRDFCSCQSLHYNNLWITMEDNWNTVFNRKVLIQRYVSTALTREKDADSKLSRISWVSVHTVTKEVQVREPELVTVQWRHKHIRTRGVPHNSDKAVQSTMQDSETFTVHLSALKAESAMSMLFIYLHQDPNTANVPPQIQWYNRIF